MNDDKIRSFLSNFSRVIRGKNARTRVVNPDRLKFNALEAAPSFFCEDVVEAMDYTLEEASVCYENQCYQATIMLCGKVVETLIKTVYEPVTGKEIYTINKNGEQIERNFKQMCNDLRTQGVLLGRGVGVLLDLIYSHRSGAIHDAIRKPGKDVTNDVMNRIFAYFNTQLQSPLSRLAS
ncbi:MAG: hypothetical protein J4F29_22820 [Candidatus Latescibacteria bacterium]|nr:hypothetical protein [Candidatus Latescibacterota bacterium]